MPWSIAAELGDHTRGDRETEQVADHLLDLSLAETVAAGERGQHGLQIRPETAWGDSFWKAPHVVTPQLGQARR